MSAYEPESATVGGGNDATRPRFQLARRGYDRQQVDRYVMELITLIEQQHQRAEHAERMLEQTRGELDERGEQQPSFVHLGVEAGKVLEQAATETRGRVDEEARIVLAEARDATNLVWQEAQQERSLVEAETTRLQAFRQDMLEHLTDVQARLTELLADARGLSGPAAVTVPVEDDAVEVDDVEAEETAEVVSQDGSAEGADGETAPMRPVEQAPTRGR